MSFELTDFLQALGPSASLIFAAWIFLSFLQARYTGAYERYRALIDEYRQGIDDDTRRGNIRHEVLLYKRRVELMRLATNIGVTSAMLLIASLVAAGVDVMVGGLSLLKYVSSLSALIGLTLVAVAAYQVITENKLIQEAIDREPADVEDLEKRAR